MATALCPFKVGDVLTFRYPVNNRRTISCSRTTRRILVRRVKDLVYEPVPAEWFRKRPDLRRSRYLLMSYDLDLETWRQFYLGSMESVYHCAMPLMQIGVYDPISSKPPTLLGPYFTDARADVAKANEILRDYNRKLRKQRRGEVARFFPVWSVE